MLERSFLFVWIFLLIFFRNFFSGVEYERNSGLKFFSPFLGLSDLVSTKNNAGKRFLKFFEFFAIFFGIFLPGSSISEIRACNIFLPFQAYLIQYWREILPERDFLSFWIFLLLFLEFSWRVEYERNSGLKFFSPFLGLSHPV